MVVTDLQQRFMALFEPQRDALWRFIRSMVRSKHEAEDIMSETVLQAYQSFESLRDTKAFASFLFTIASRLHKRHRWRRSFFGEFDEEATAAKPHTDPQPDAQYDVMLLRKALQALPLKQRESVVLFDVLGLSLEEVRDVQGGTLSGVKSRLLRGRQTLAQKLDAVKPPVVSATAPYTNGISTNGVATNGVTTNGVGTNGVATNGVASNGVASNGVATNGAAKQTINST